MDVRTRYTRNILKESLVDLLSSYSLREITVKQLCGKADVNKSTLYAHYADLYALYEDAEEDFLQKIMEVSFKNSGASNQKERKQHYVNVCNFFKDNKKYLLAFYNSGSGSDFVEKIGIRMADGVLQAKPEPLSSSQEMNIRLRLGYSNSGYMYIIYAWLMHYPDLPVEEIADVLISERRSSASYTNTMPD